MKKKEIIFYAPLGRNVPPEKIGGAEAGCRKTQLIYEKAGISVIILEKPAVSKGKIRFFLDMLLIPCKLYILLWRYPNAVLHIVGFYTKIAWFELLLIRIGKITGHKIIYELRNGSMVRTYEEGGDIYKKILKRLLLLPDIVLCQGMEYIDFIQRKWNIRRSYYPNYLMDSYLNGDNIMRKTHPIKLIYFGRVTESKNVDLIIKVLAIIRKEGIEATLDIIGGCNEKYKAILDKVVLNQHMQDYVFFYGRKPFDFIVEKLRQSHYFVFPSQEKQEGHSNSLTEAMGCGVVPIVSTAGFNVSICGNEQLVVKKMDASDYAQKIIEIEHSGLWRKYSQDVYLRVKNNFSESIVSNSLINSIMPLFEK